MPIRESHAPGTPSWVDLATTDVEGALDFYRAVMGWDYERDPTGAMFCTWTPITAIGAGIVNAPGAFTWAEVATHDDDAAAAFYCELFGWETGTMEEAPDGPVVFTLDGTPVASTSMAPLPPGVPPHWRVSFGVSDVDAACGTATARGGNVIVPPFDFGPGRAATVSDPAGAMFDVVTLTDWPS